MGCAIAPSCPATSSNFDAQLTVLTLTLIALIWYTAFTYEMARTTRATLERVQRMDSWRERRFRAKLSEFLEHFHGHVSKWPVGESLEEIKGVVKGQVSQLSDPQSHAGLLSTAFEIDGETYIEAIAFSNALTDIKDYTSNRDDQRLQLAVMQAKKLIDSLVASNEKALRALEVQPEE